MQLQIIRKYLKIILLAVPCIVVMWKMSPFEIANAQLSDVVCYTLWSVIAVGILVMGNLFIYEGNKRDAAFRILLLIFFNLSVGLFIYCFSMFIIIGSVGGFQESVLYVHRSNESIKIIRQNYDQGAWDSGDIDYRFRKVSYVTPYVRYVHEIDTSAIDKREWVKVQ